MKTRLAAVAAQVGCLYFLVNGVWAFFAPRNFFELVAQWSPYNEHFLRDAGALALGIGVALALLLARVIASVVVLAGTATAGVAHAISHMLDHGEGGRDSDPYLLGVLALLFVVALLREWKAYA